MFTNSQSNVSQKISGSHVPEKDKDKLVSYSKRIEQEIKELEDKYGQLKSEYKKKSDRLKVIGEKNTAMKNELVQRKLLIKEMEKMQSNEEDVNKKQRIKIDELRSELLHIRNKQLTDLDEYEQNASRLAERLLTLQPQYEEPNLLQSITELNEELKKREAEVCKCLSDIDTKTNLFNLEVQPTRNLVKDLNCAINIIDGKTNEINEDIKILRSELKSYTKMMDDLSEQFKHLKDNN